LVTVVPSPDAVAVVEACVDVSVFAFLFARLVAAPRADDALRNAKNCDVLGKSDFTVTSRVCASSKGTFNASRRPPACIHAVASCWDT
jgi:hypothetical protein